MKEGRWESPDTIRSSIRISYSKFLDPISFENCYFIKEVSFFNDTLIGDVNFEHSTFEVDADFWQSIFGGWADFSFATFEADCGFSLCTFINEVTFTATTFKGDAYFGLTTFAWQVKLDYSKFTNFHVTWKQLKDRLICGPPVYSKLIKSFEENRQLDDADGVYLFLKNKERIEKLWYIRYPEYWFIQQTCGYGIVWWRPLLTSLIVVMLFTFLYFKLVLQEKGLPLPNSGSKRFWKKLWNAFYYSINTFIVGIPANWKVENKTKDFFAFRVLTTMERTLGWILLAVFVVTLTRKFIR